MNAVEQKPEKKKRVYKGRQVNVRFTDEEYSDLKAIAEATGQTIPHIVKNAIRSKKITPKKPPKISDKIALSMASELRHIGRNINQIAKHLNSGGNVTKEHIEAFQRVRKGLGHIWRTLK